MKQFSLFCILALLSLPVPALAEAERGLQRLGADGERVALIIGNAAYETGPLKNPINDARAMSAKLKELGFTVIERQNLKQRQIGSALREFRSRLRPGGTALFFYAGHGLQVKGINYLPAVDADIYAEEDVPTQAIDVNKVLEVMEESKTAVNLVFLDACRNNPYKRSFRSAASGLASIKSASSGTLIFYATRPGSVAADGGGRNGLYTTHLLSALDQAGLTAEQVQKRVAQEVERDSHGKQEPWMEGLLKGEFYFRPNTQVASLTPLPAPQAATDLDAAERAEWALVQAAGTPEAVQRYLDGVRSGKWRGLFVQKAAALLKRLSPASVGPPETSGRLPYEPEMVAIPGRNYEIGKYEVTQAQWGKVMEDYPSYFKTCDDCPVERVSWNDVQEFLKKLNQNTGKDYRLPTEEEWEHACRGGKQQEYCDGGGQEAVGWFSSNAGYTTHTVGQKQANGYGLFDMTGNVSEWTQDCWNSDCSERVVRGGSFVNSPYMESATHRRPRAVTEKGVNLGFRIVNTK